LLVDVCEHLYLVVYSLVLPVRVLRSRYLNFLLFFLFLLLEFLVSLIQQLTYLLFLVILLLLHKLSFASFMLNLPNALLEPILARKLSLIDFRLHFSLELVF
jgi:hypothetical protein